MNECDSGKGKSKRKSPCYLIDIKSDKVDSALVSFSERPASETCFTFSPNKRVIEYAYSALVKDIGRERPDVIAATLCKLFRLDYV